MKHFINLFLIVCINLTFVLIAFSQCGTILTQQQIDYMNITRLDRSETGLSLFSINSEPITLPLVAHIIRNSQGNGGLTEANLKAGIEELNKAFESVDIIFKLCQINYIDNNKYFVSLTKSLDAQSEEYQMAKPNLVPDAVNVFFLPQIVNNQNDNLCGWSSFPSYKDDIDKDWTVMDNDCVIGYNILAHELGHYFNLYHTHQGNNGYLEVYQNELVDRSNCGPNVGDELCDTPAEPTLNQVGYDGILNCVNENCKYNCNDVDSLGVKYKPDGDNIMSYTYWGCANYFSPQQIVRIQESLAYDRSYLSFDCSDECVYGCMDEMAINYNSEATCSNNSCEYPVYGCTNSLACNYNPSANQNDGTCNFGNVNCPNPCIHCFIPGCTKVNACNYDPISNFDDGTCNFGNESCLDPCDADSCIIEGCTNDQACNYNPLANQDNDSCDFGNQNCADPCNVGTCIDCSKNSGKIISLMCGISFNYYIETDQGEYFMPVFNQILPFRIKQGKKVNFDYKPIHKEKGSLSACKYGNTKVLITCIEEVIENKPDNLFDESFDSGFSPFGSATSNQLNSEFLVYPNPSKGELFVMIENEQLQTNTLNVYNINGEQVNFQTSIEMMGGIIELDLTAQPKGIYLIEMRKGDYTFTQKVLIE